MVIVDLAGSVDVRGQCCYEISLLPADETDRLAAVSMLDAILLPYK